ncbi:M23 family metallopeptidase, partial [Arthrobacter sp.]|uniref:M23 family metallopeptidase n=1 Tax=Arthrobacter sp. TaxID=1667 RepID=UPI002811B0A0
MGNHAAATGPGSRSNGPCALAVRILGATVTVALAGLAFGVQGPGSQNPVASTAHPGTTASGVTPGAAGSAEGAGVHDPVGFTADPAALISFSRSIVRTTSKDGKHELNVAIKDMRRPPAGSLMAPLEVLVPSSPFGLRTSPMTGAAGEFHWGQDFAAPCGTRVYSADAGVVRAVGWHLWGGGNRVEIDHGNGLITTYNHLEAIAVKKGESVQVGEVIARVGTTGSSTGCHLHFETILNGKHANPADWKLLPTKQVDELGSLEMVSYAPGQKHPDGAETPQWAIPVAADGAHEVDGGHDHSDPGADGTSGQDPNPPSPAPSPSPSTPAVPTPT